MRGIRYLVVGLLACGPAKQETTSPAATTADSCGGCTDGDACMEYYRIGEPETEISTCETACVIGDYGCPENQTCTMIANGPGMVCRPVPDVPSYDRSVSNLTALVKVWGAIKFTHPRIYSSTLDWDTALMAAVGGAKRASSDSALATVVSDMLSTLDDPMTGVIRAEKSPATDPSFRWQGDETLIVDLGTGEFNRVDRLRELAAEIPRAKRLIFDLRSVVSSDEVFLDFSFGLFQAALVSTKTDLPTTRSVSHMGYRGQTYDNSYVYSSKFDVGMPENVEGTGKDGLRIAFVLGESRALPKIAVPLWQSGRAALVGTTTVDARSLHPTTSFEFVPGWTVRIRSGSAIYRDQPVTLKADAIDANDPIAAAMRLLSKPAKRRPLEARTRPSLTWSRDATYPSTETLTLELRVLAVARVWNIIRYFYPYLDQLEDWDAVLPKFLARIEAIDSTEAYTLAMAEMAAHIADSHTGLVGPGAEKFLPRALPPFEVSVLKGAVVVTSIGDPAKTPGIEVGDIIEAIEGVPMAAAYARLAPRVAASTPRGHLILGALKALAGRRGETRKLTVLGRNGVRKETAVKLGARPKPTGEPFRKLSDDLGYVDLRVLEPEMIDEMFKLLGETKGIIFDMRGYPKFTTVRQLQPRFVRGDRPLAYARYGVPVVQNPKPDASIALHDNIMVRPKSDKPPYRGETVMLIDERAISLSEGTAMFFKAATGATFVGSETLGANGDVTAMTLPGDLVLRFTGASVRFLDGSRLQRVGIQPDIRVEPSIEGLRAGKDEVLDAAIAHLRSRPSPRKAASPLRPEDG